MSHPIFSDPDYAPYPQQPRVLRTEDGRAPIDRLRRIELWHLADRYRVPYPNGATKDEMLRIFRESVQNGLDLSKPPRPADQPPPGPPLPEQIEKMELNQLRRLAKSRGLKLERTDGKASIIAKLKVSAN